MRLLVFLLLFVTICSANKKLGLPLKLADNAIDQLEQVAKSSIANKLFKGVGKAANILGPVGFAVSIALAIVEDDDEVIEKLDEISVKLDNINEKLEKVLESLETLEDVLIHESNSIKLEIKNEPLSKIKSKINATELDLINYVKNYGSDKEILAENLNILITERNRVNLENDLVSLTSKSFQGSNTIVEIMKKIARSQLEENSLKCSIVTSPMKIIYDLYMLFAYQIFRVNAITELALNIKKASGGKCSDQDFNFIQHRRDDALKLLFTSMKNSFEDLKESDVDCCYSKNGDLNAVKFSRVIQVFFEHQSSLEGDRGTCDLYCTDFKKEKFHNRGCYGYVEKCAKVECKYP